MKIRNTAILLTFLLISLASFTTIKETHKKDNLLFLLRQPEHINQAIKTIVSLKNGNHSNLSVGRVVIIVCGEAVVNLTTEEGKAWVDQINKLSNVSILACGLSLEKFKKTEADIVPGIGYTENGFVKAFQLQKEGYLSVEL